MIDFSGIDAKIDRANCQVDALNADIDEFCLNIKRSIVHEIDRDAGEQMWFYRGATPEVPIEWSIRAGEILYNLRSALDHLVWQLVVANGQKPSKDNQFPILDEEAQWTNRGTQNKLKGVADECKKTIRFLQPFNPMLQLPINGQLRPCYAQVFRTLRDLCNIDKHRHLNFILVGMAGIEPIVFGENHPPRRPTDQQLAGRMRGRRIEQDRSLLVFNDIEQEMKPSFRIAVSFDCLERHNLTRNSVTEQLCDCLEAVQGGCELFRRV